MLVLRRHATELFELDRGERARLMDEVSDVARALRQAFDARKVNYALFGNVLPHVHWHLVPRLAADPAPREPVFAVAHEPVALGATERAARIARIRSRLEPVNAGGATGAPAPVWWRRWPPSRWAPAARPGGRRP